MSHDDFPRAPAAARPHQAWTLVLASLGLFMVALDTLVVTTALPVLRADLGAKLTDLEWTVNAYNLAFACLLLTGAALGDRFGRRRVYAIGVLGFAVASAAAAMSGSVGALIAARAVQGGFAAIVMPLTLTLISQAFPAEKRGMAIGLWGGIAGLAVAMGPVVGGAITNGLAWQWIFWLNVPVGLALAPLALRRLTESFGPRPRLDPVGLALAGTGFLGLTWGLVRASTVGWGSAEVLLSLLAGTALVTGFLAWQRRARNPMLPLGLFRLRAFSTANGVSFFMYASLFGALFLMSQFLQIGLGNSPLAAGLWILPWTATPMVVAPIAGALSERFGNRPFMAAGLALQAAGLGWVAAIAAPGMGYAQLSVALTVAGVGTSMCFPTVANAVMGSVPQQEAGVASGTNSAIRELGGVFGVAVLAAIFTGPAVYGSPDAFVDAFRPALGVGAGLAVVGIVSALLAPRRAGTPREGGPGPAGRPAEPPAVRTVRTGA
ncbi:MFS transporter [Streptomyces sp. CB01881]|uniref:MFS transporter n=1 Tax=Streptomyces sp. CB01881 TaxID=2078691 RepID=UPI000CDBEF41|nr:MFS transporter [Streptomyces sp. CB01881]AUY47663.1 MFS transporter [Streptomyces sp. CB01881]TYC76136.1 DHA2 family efflux MFS transporter permease subunit [Streptomyces sp. CB01881]